MPINRNPPEGGTSNLDDVKTHAHNEPIKHPGDRGLNIYSMSDTRSKRKRNFMRCPTCGKSYPDDMHFCPVCGTPLEAENETEVPDSGNPIPDDSGTDHSVPRHHGKRTATIISVLVVAAMAVVAIVILTRKTPVTPPADEVVLEEYQQGTSSPDVSTASSWGSNDGFEIVSSEVEGPNNDSADSSAREYSTFIIVTYENASFRVTEERLLGFSEESDGAWEKTSDDVQETSTEPIAGITDDSAMSNISAILSEAQSASSGQTTDLSSIYSSPANISIASNETTSAGGTVTFVLSSETDTDTYSGGLLATFSWDAEKGDWTLATCTATDDSWNPVPKPSTTMSDAPSSNTSTTTAESSSSGSDSDPTSYIGSFDRFDADEKIWDEGRSWTGVDIHVDVQDADADTITFIADVACFYGPSSGYKEMRTEPIVVEISSGSSDFDWETSSGEYGTGSISLISPSEIELSMTTLESGGERMTPEFDSKVLERQ
jgi:hypothetical protein